MKSKAIIFFLLMLSSVTILSQKKSISILKFEKFECEADSDNYRKVRTRIIKKEINKNILSLEIGAWAICCADFSPVVKLENGVLDLNLAASGEPCECSCFYRFRFTIKGIDRDPHQIKLKGQPIMVSKERYETFPISFKIVKGDTINYKDKYGQRQGKWSDQDDSLMVKRFFVFKDGMILKSIKLYANGKVKSQSSRELMKTESGDKLFSNYNKYVEYYESGQKMKECFVSGWRLSYKDGVCQEWNERGELIYEGPHKEE